jgi:hypothetical protein
MDENQINNDAGVISNYEIEEQELQQQAIEQLEWRTELINNFCKMNDYINDYNQSVWMFNFKPSKLDILRVLDMYYRDISFPLKLNNRYINSPYTLSFESSMIQTKHNILLQKLYKIYKHLFYNTNKDHIRYTLLYDWKYNRNELKIGCFYELWKNKEDYNKTYFILTNITDKSYVFQYLYYPYMMGDFFGEPVLKTSKINKKDFYQIYSYNRKFKDLDNYKYKKIRDYFDNQYHNSKRGQKISSTIMIEEERFDRY